MLGTKTSGLHQRGYNKAKQASKGTMYSSGLISHRNPWFQYWVVPTACIPGIPAQAYGPLSRPRSRGATVSDTTQSGPQQYGLFSNNPWAFKGSF